MVLNKRLFIVLLLLYFFINLIFLTKFPFVHSDEPWLSGLSRNILELKSFSVTETFFDLYERNPHAIKVIFHLLQICFLKIFGYSIFTFRLISLIFGSLTLLFFYKLSYLLLTSKKYAFISTILLAVDVQFIYASHFARQEIVILFALIIGLYIFFKYSKFDYYYRDLIVGILIGITIGIHPNSFIISLPFALLYLQKIYIKKLTIINLLIYVFTVSLFAVFFIFLSFMFDPDFINNYTNYGNQFGVLNSITSKASQLKDFYLKLYYGISGTYYTPNIKFEFYLFAVVFVITLIKLLFIAEKSERRSLTSLILIILAINAGILIIGRFNATSVVFLFPAFYILTAFIIKDFSKMKFSYAILSAAILINTVNNIYPYLNHSYDKYLTEIEKVLNQDDKVLANLNCEYYFENGKLYDYRNLAFLKDYNMDFSDYIYDRSIKYIVYSEEMDFIYNSRPVWNGIYGNLYFYYEDMHSFLNTRCTLMYEFKDNIYGIRIARYMNKKDWRIKIYKVNE